MTDHNNRIRIVIGVAADVDSFLSGVAVAFSLMFFGSFAVLGLAWSWGVVPALIVALSVPLLMIVLLTGERAAAGQVAETECKQLPVRRQP